MSRRPPGSTRTDNTLSLHDALPVFAMAGLPLMIAGLEREGREAAVDVARRNAEMIVLVAFPAAVGLGVVAEPLASVLIGAEFRSAAGELVPWIVAAALMNGIMAHYVHNAFILSRRTDLMAWKIGRAHV